MKKVTGFTLIELMIVIAILGILLGIAIPAYQTYIIRTKVSEGLMLASTAKTAVSLTQAEIGSLPGSNSEAGLDSSITSEYVQAINVQSNGKIQITLQNIASSVNGHSIVLVPSTTGEVIDWVCSQAPANAVPTKYLPSTCR